MTAIVHLVPIRARAVLRVGTTGDFNPMSFRDPVSGTYRGFDVEAMERLAADLGVRVEWALTEWSRFVAGLAANRFDIFSGASVTQARAREAAFSEPYFEFATVPVVSKVAALRLKSWDDMNAAGVRIAVTAGTPFEEQARRHFPKARIILVQAPAAGYQEVVGGQADLALTSNVEAAVLLKRFSSLVLTTASEQPRDRRPAAFVVAKDDPEWLDTVNAWVRAKTAEGFFKVLEAKWLAKA